MKARTLVLMLCIGLMCSTGFGFTTADLTDNSKTEIVQADDAVNVVTIEAQFLELESLDFDVSEEMKIFNYSEDFINGIPSIEFQKTDINLDKIIDDVGWQFNSKNYNLHKPVSYSRNPRDGICHDFLS